MQRRAEKRSQKIGSSEDEPSGLNTLSLLYFSKAVGDSILWTLITLDTQKSRRREEDTEEKDSKMITHKICCNFLKSPFGGRSSAPAERPQETQSTTVNTESRPCSSDAAAYRRVNGKLLARRTTIDTGHP